MKNLLKTITAAPLLFSAIPGAHALDLPFLGTVDPVCTMLVVSDGAMKSSATGKVLGSKELGGTPGVVTIISNTGALEVTTTAPTAFTTAPTGGGDAVTFETSYTLPTVGTNILGDTASNVPIGINVLSVDLTATKTSGTFPAGDYVANVTVTCD